jgi:hypothetical protein
MSCPVVPSSNLVVGLNGAPITREGSSSRSGVGGPHHDDPDHAEHKAGLIEQLGLAVSIPCGGAAYEWVNTGIGNNKKVPVFLEVD